jgi:hypothetical protein
VCIANGGEHRQRVHDVAQRAHADDENAPHVRWIRDSRSRVE